MSLIDIINRIEHERALNQTLLETLLADVDSDIRRLEQRKVDLAQEFAERDASLLVCISGDVPKPMELPRRGKRETPTNEADIAA